MSMSTSPRKRGEVRKKPLGKPGGAFVLMITQSVIARSKPGDDSGTGNSVV